MKSKEESKQQATRFGSGPKKIMCQCNAVLTDGEIITMQLNSRCPVCNSLHYISVPKPKVQAIQRPKQQTSVLRTDSYMDRRVQMGRELNEHIVGYRPTDWLTGILAL